MKRINCYRVLAIEFNSSNTIQQHQPTYKDITNIFFIVNCRHVQALEQLNLIAT